jgi:hypothetical protein
VLTEASATVEVVQQGLSSSFMALDATRMPAAHARTSSRRRVTA